MDAAVAIDQSRISSFQYRVYVICFLAAVVDGLDVQLLPYVAPTLMKDFAIAGPLLGTLVSAGLIGMVISGLLGGVLADKAGRRPVILGSLLIFALTTIVKAFSATYEALLLMQFVCGLGLGAAFMNVLALAGDYSPAKSRRFIVTCVSTGYPVGGIVAGYVAALVAPQYGWQAVFFAGGGAALTVFVVCFVWLPHSVRQLLLAGRSPDLAVAIMAQITGARLDTHWTISEPKSVSLPLFEIFKEGRAVLSYLLGVAVMMTLMAGYFVGSWSPMLLNLAGTSLERAVIATSTMHAGSVIGALVWARLSDLIWPPAVFAVAALLIAVCFGVVGHVAASYPLILTIFFIGGMGIGVQNAYGGFITSVYPTAMRGTALGFIIGLGRVGSICGPLIGGTLMAARWSVAQLYYVPTAAALVIMLCMVFASALPSSRLIIVESRQLKKK
jgi:AAHS family 4-hydroxybenzoate transporter-like MFS transporter